MLLLKSIFIPIFYEILSFMYSSEKKKIKDKCLKIYHVIHQIFKLFFFSPQYKKCILNHLIKCMNVKRVKISIRNYGMNNEHT
jgi:hypothetical protein